MEYVMFALDWARVHDYPRTVVAEPLDAASKGLCENKREKDKRSTYFNRRTLYFTKKTTYSNTKFDMIDLNKWLT